MAHNKLKTSNSFNLRQFETIEIFSFLHGLLHRFFPYRDRLNLSTISMDGLHVSPVIVLLISIFYEAGYIIMKTDLFTFLCCQLWTCHPWKTRKVFFESRGHLPCLCTWSMHTLLYQCLVCLLP